MRSRTTRSRRSSPTRNWFCSSSPTERMRRLPRWSMSSLLTLPDCTLIKRRRTAIMSSRVRARFCAADAREIVALLVEEQRFEELLRVLGVLGLAGTELLVDLLERVFLRLDVFVFFETVRDQRRVVEQGQDRFVRFPGVAEVGARERAHERRRVDFPVLVDANADRALGLV